MYDLLNVKKNQSQQHSLSFYLKKTKKNFHIHVLLPLSENPRFHTPKNILRDDIPEQ